MLMRSAHYRDATVHVRHIFKTNKSVEALPGLSLESSESVGGRLSPEKMIVINNLPPPGSL